MAFLQAIHHVGEDGPRVGPQLRRAEVVRPAGVHEALRRPVGVLVEVDERAVGWRDAHQHDAVGLVGEQPQVALGPVRAVGAPLDDHVLPGLPREVDQGAHVDRRVGGCHRFHPTPDLDLQVVEAVVHLAVGDVRAVGRVLGLLHRAAEAGGVAGPPVVEGINIEIRHPRLEFLHEVRVADRPGGAGSTRQEPELGRRQLARREPLDADGHRLPIRRLPEEWDRDVGTLGQPVVLALVQAAGCPRHRRVFERVGELVHRASVAIGISVAVHITVGRSTVIGRAGVVGFAAGGEESCPN